MHKPLNFINFSLPSIYSSLKPMENGEVYMRKNQTCKILGTRTVIIKMIDKFEKTLHKVRYVPSLKRKKVDC